MDWVDGAMIEIDGWAGTLLLLAPPALLLLVIVYVTRGAATAKTEAETTKTEAEAETTKTETETETETETTKIPSPTIPSSAQGIADFGAGAEPAEDNGLGEAARHLALARTEIANGRNEQAAGHLRSCIRAAVGTGDEAAAAEARLGLAELAREAGDLTTACEHWQIARALFHQLQEKPALARTEELMRRHGCPTDWVLNDF